VSAPTNQWKLGAFVLGSVGAGLALIAVLVAQSLQVQAVTYTSYFDEAVAGLEVGSPITFRGVKIGNITAIEVAPDLRHVQIIYSLGVAVIKRLGLGGSSRGKETRLAVPPNLRVQIGSTGLTGIKYLQLDFFDAQGTPPPPVLPFGVPDNYIPATPSTLKNLEDAVLSAVDQLPVLTQELAKLVARVGQMADDIDQRGLPAKAAATLAHTDQMLTSLKARLDELPVRELSREVTATAQGARAALAKLDLVLGRIDGQEGLVASLQRTSESWSDAAGPKLGQNLGTTGRDLREAVAAFRQLVEALQRDPDMLLKGRTKANR
jgi:paraquat-inducible protein B